MALINLTGLPFWLVLVIDIGLLIAVPAIILKSFWRGVIVAVGFVLTQFTYHNQPWTELGFELVGLIIIIYACIYKKKEAKIK